MLYNLCFLISAFLPCPQAEVDAVLGDRLSPTMADYGQLRYVLRCVNESMRLYPHPPVLLRRALVADELPGGYQVGREGGGEAGGWGPQPQCGKSTEPRVGKIEGGGDRAGRAARGVPERAGGRVDWCVFCRGVVGCHAVLSRRGCAYNLRKPCDASGSHGNAGAFTQIGSG